MTTATLEKPNGTVPDSAQQSEAQSMLVANTGGAISTRPADDSLGVLGALIDNQAWNRMVKIAETFSKSDLVPKHFQGKMANCIIALQCAIRMQVDPFMLMQNMYIVHGKPGIEAKFAIALANAKKVFRGPIRYVLSGEGMKRQCVAWAIDRETGDKLEETVTMEMAKKEGWMSKDGSKWLTIPDLMLKYRSAMWLIRTTCPEVLMGMQATDELVDATPPVMPADARQIDNRSASDKLADVLEGSVARQAASDPAPEQTTDELEQFPDEQQQDPDYAPNPYAMGEQEEPESYVGRIKKAIVGTLDKAVLEQIEIGASGSEPLLQDAHKEAVARALAKRREQVK